MNPFVKIFGGNEALSAPWRTYSTHNTWPDFRMDEYRWPAMKLPARRYEMHTLTFNIGMPLHFSWNQANRWQESECNTGNVVGLLNAGDTEEILWEGEYNAFTLSITPAFVDQLLETSGFRFKEQHNLNDPFLSQACRILYLQV